MKASFTIPDLKVKDFESINALTESLKGTDLKGIVDALSTFFDAKTLLNLTPHQLMELAVEVLKSVKKEFKKTLKINGREYKLLTNYSVSWYADYETLFHARRGKIPPEEVMALNYIPSTCKHWTDVDFKQSVDDLKDVDLGLYLGLLDFFLSVEKVRQMIMETAKTSS